MFTPLIEAMTEGHGRSAAGLFGAEFTARVLARLMAKRIAFACYLEHEYDEGQTWVVTVPLDSADELRAAVAGV